MKDRAETRAGCFAAAHPSQKAVRGRPRGPTSVRWCPCLSAVSASGESELSSAGSSTCAKEAPDKANSTAAAANAARPASQEVEALAPAAR